MKFVIDTDQLKNAYCSVSLGMYLISLYCNENINKDTFIDACTRGLVDFNGYNNNEPISPRLTQTGIDYIERIFLNSEYREEGATEDRFDVLAKKLQEIFPKGRKGNTVYTWRDSSPIIAKKLKTLVKKFNIEFTDEQAINATRKYVESFNGDYTYMKLLKYFIFKMDPKYDEDGKRICEETSELMNYIQNEKDLNVTHNDNAEVI